MKVKAKVIVLYTLLLCCFSFMSVYAQDDIQDTSKPKPQPRQKSQPKQQPQPKQTPTPTHNPKQKIIACKEGYELPDLIITNVEVLKSNELVISVKNIGLCASPPTKVWIDDPKRPKPIFIANYGISDWDKEIAKYLTVEIPALNSNQAYKIKKHYWTEYKDNSGIGAWQHYLNGGFSDFTFVIDIFREIHEANEYNNDYMLKPPPK